jgi:hypothetical protein
MRHLLQTNDTNSTVVANLHKARLLKLGSKQQINYHTPFCPNTFVDSLRKALKAVKAANIAVYDQSRRQLTK